MIGIKALERSAALYGSCTAFAAVWITLALPIRQDRVGGNYQKMLRAARRVPWKKLPKAI